MKVSLLKSTSAFKSTQQAVKKLFDHQIRAFVQMQKTPKLKTNTNEVNLNYSISNQETYNENNKNILLLHGLFGNKNNLRGISYTEELKSLRNPILVDLRNHGNSDHHASMTYKEMANDVKRLVTDTLKIEKKFTLVGHSMGAKTAMTFACMYPELIDGLFIIDAMPQSHLHNPDLFSSVKTVVDTIYNYDITSTSRQDTLKYFYEKLGGAIANLLNTNLITTEKTELMWRINIKSIHDCLDNIIGWEQSGTYEGPVRVLNGEKSFRFSLDNFTKTFPLMKNKDIRIIQGANHWVHADKPEETAKEMIKFIREIDEGKI